MKRLFFTLLLSAALCSVSFAQRFRVGLRTGVNIADFSLPATSSDNGVLTTGRSKAGFEASLAARLAITKHINIQTEFEYDRVNYAFHLSGTSGIRDITVNTNRIEIPLLLGLDFGPVRLFGGASFRISHNEKSSAPSLFGIKFDDSKVALTGGAGLNIRRFFLEGRITGYPKGSTNIVRLNGNDYRIDTRRYHKWSISAGVLF